MASPSLPALEAFVSVARHRSFSMAAAERGVSTSALSHVIRSLEDGLGVRLFNRTSRSVRITAAGEHLLASVRPALGDIAEAVDTLDKFRDRPSGLLRLNVPRVALVLIVQPVLARFHATYPEVRLDVTSDDGLVDIVAGGYDAGISRDRRLSPGMIETPMGPAGRFAVVGSPDYLARRGRPLVPQDLHSHACIERRYPGGARYAWEFARAEEMLEIEVTGPLIIDDSALMIHAATAGMALAFVHEALVAGPLARGDLVRVLEDWCPVLPRFHLYYPGRRQVPAALRAFIENARAVLGG